MRLLLPRHPQSSEDVPYKQHGQAVGGVKANLIEQLVSPARNNLCSRRNWSVLSVIHRVLSKSSWTLLQQSELKLKAEKTNNMWKTHRSEVSR